MRWYVARLLVLLLLGGFVSLSGAMDADLRQAQQQLGRLGYEPGVADGVYGPRTRQALEAFQRAKGLPLTGILDDATRQALDAVSPATTVAPPAPVVMTKSPLQVVIDYFRFHESQPARLLQHVTANFLNGTDPQLWIDQAIQARLTQTLTYVSWKVQKVDIVETQATVRVFTRVRVHGQDHVRAEVFTLLRTPEGEWLIDAWQIEPLVPEGQRPQTR
jgi:peptidoglycan hydrolase-like protein with peptidoglycan-binding domain